MMMPRNRECPDLLPGPEVEVVPGGTEEMDLIVPVYQPSAAVYQARVAGSGRGLAQEYAAGDAVRGECL